MLIILVIFLFIASILILAAKRNNESYYMAGMCMSLAIMLTGILIFIAKKGGISKELNNFFYFNHEIKTAIQYRVITINKLGFTIALGRYLFPLFFVFTTIQYSMVSFIRKTKYIMPVITIFPIASLIVYYPKVFKFLTQNNDWLRSWIISITNVWIFIYVTIAILLLLHEAHSISINFFRRRFTTICIFLTSLSILYLLYFGQDPAQVYNFYGDTYIWKQGIYYMNAVLPIPAYIIILFINLICAITGITSLYRFAQSSFVSNREEVVRQRKIKEISPVTSVFVHSIKNQLLANRVVYKRINQLIETEGQIENRKENQVERHSENQQNTDKIYYYLNTLSKNNELMLSRMDQLYRSIKSNSVYMVPTPLVELIKGALDLFNNKYPNVRPEVKFEKNITVLADKSHMCEAIYNLLSNAQEAIEETDNKKAGKISLLCYNERLYTIIEVVDNGIGIDKKLSKKIVEPFYSSKNSNYNWGMGLHYVRAIVKEHYGILRYESEKGSGSHFYIILPKYKD